MSRPIDTLPTLEEIDTELAERRFRKFVEQAWPVVEPATPFVPGWHIDAICDHLEAVARGDIRRLVIMIPPRHTKSLLTAVLFPAWMWAREGHASDRFLFASYALSLSIRDSVKCRRIIESAWYQKRWARRFTLTSDENMKMRFMNDQTGVRLATSVGGAATGEGGDYVIVDDPHNIEEAESDEIRRGVLTWWDEVMSTRLNDPKTGRFVLIQQRVHHEDLAGHVLQQSGWEALTLPAEWEPDRMRTTTIGWRDPRTTEGELLWPARFGTAELSDLKSRLGTHAYSGQYQQRPTPRLGGLIKRADIQFYSALPNDLDDLIQSWDMTFKETTSGSYVVGQVWGRKGGVFYLVDQVRDRMNFPATCAAVRSLSAKYPRAVAKLVEEAANGPAVIAALMQEVPGLLPVKPAGSKEARMAAISPYFEAHNVFVPDPGTAPWVHDWIEEIITFPKAAHDDQADATSQALARLGFGPAPYVEDDGEMDWGLLSEDEVAGTFLQ